jgi:hypothetical protein
MEGAKAENLIILVEGCVDAFKQLDATKSDENKTFDTSAIPLWPNPKDSGNQAVGIKIGVFEGHQTIGEDSLIF